LLSEIYNKAEKGLLLGRSARETPQAEIAHPHALSVSSLATAAAGRQQRCPASKAKGVGAEHLGVVLCEREMAARVRASVGWRGPAVIRAYRAGAELAWRGRCIPVWWRLLPSMLGRALPRWAKAG
jgi:hypothetical protein